MSKRPISQPSFEKDPTLASLNLFCFETEIVSKRTNDTRELHLQDLVPSSTQRCYSQPSYLFPFLLMFKRLKFRITRSISAPTAIILRSTSLVLRYQIPTAFGFRTDPGCGVFPLRSCRSQLIPKQLPCSQTTLKQQTPRPQVSLFRFTSSDVLFISTGRA